MAAEAPVFDDFYRARWAPMVRLAWTMTGSRAQAEDIVQDAFLRVRAAWDRIDSPGAYLRTAVVNGVRGHQRRLVLFDRRRALLVSEEETGDPEIDETGRALARLPARQRHALALRFYADLPFEEIAEHLGCRPATARSLVHRGLATLRETWER